MVSICFQKKSFFLILSEVDFSQIFIFLRSARDYGGIIDYGLTFTKRGRKPYLTLIDREIYHLFKIDFLALVLDRTMAISSHICNIIDIIN